MRPVTGSIRDYHPNPERASRAVATLHRAYGFWHWWGTPSKSHGSRSSTELIGVTDWGIRVSCIMRFNQIHLWRDTHGEMHRSWSELALR
ncbi:MAG: hypothetical protein C7B45_14710 [Sulfobacillus acidophilus]|uniref:Uncharacterized protein n=1 Tax=Sulfobacillus acidophilus TaxID=53633 RepID=A0A2T2WE57_9FIRM|nr:MAG: hypothetical protein C7B45_14710 [Sulfobacillus acidophilus]